jgi:hypothetical protein
MTAAPSPPPSRPPIVTLTTDFGLEGHHVGVMKGVILSQAPHAVLVDLCHGISGGGVEEGAWILLWSWKHFPAGTVHAAVVDPGVGSRRRALAARAGGHCFVGPDNGLLAPVIEAAGTADVVELSAREGTGAVSSTFHGRDVFAPAAARLCLGSPLEELGDRITDLVGLSLSRPRVIRRGLLEGKVITIDPFGNLVTDITAADLTEAAVGGSAVVRIAREVINGLSGHYAEAGAGKAFALLNSSGHLEIGLYLGRAAEVLGAGRGQAVQVEAH